MATINHSSGADIIVPSNNGTTYRGLGGDDTYILSNSIAANAAITIVDTSGANTIQLVDGLSIASSKFAADAVQLTLSNGAVVTINGASNFTYDLGGNATAGVTGSSNTLSEFASTMGVATLPTSGSTAGSSDVSINNSGISSTASPTFTVTKDTSKVAEGSEVTFTITASSAVSSDTTFSWSAMGDTNGSTVSAATNADITTLSGSATIASGSTSATFTVGAVADASVEGLEGMKVSVFDSNASAVSSSTILIDNTGSATTTQSFVGTTGVNNFTGGDGNDSFDFSTAASFQDIDAVDGAGGSDTITISYAGTSALKPEIENVETFVISNTGANTTTLTINAVDTASGYDSITNLASSGALTINNLQSLPSMIKMNSAGDDFTLDFEAAALAGTSDNLNVTISGTDTTTVPTLTLTADGTADLESLTLNSTAQANTLTTVTTADVDVATLNITGDQSLTITDALSSEISTVDGSASTGGFTLSAAPGAVLGVAITGGAGNDVFTGTAAGADNLAGGAGDDTITMTNLTATDTIDGGAGTDKIVTAQAMASATIAGGVSNVEQIEITGTTVAYTLAADTSFYDFDISNADKQTITLDEGYTQATTVRLAKYGAASVVSDAVGTDIVTNTANVTLDVYASSEGLDTAASISGGTGTDNLWIFLGGNADATLVNSVSGVENFVIMDSPFGNTATTITLGAYNPGTGKNITIDASALDALDTNAFVVDASSVTAATTGKQITYTDGANAGKITLGNDDDTANMGAGDDTVVGTAGKNTIDMGAGNDSVTAGTGIENISGGDGNDTINMAANITALDTIDGGAGADTINVSGNVANATILGGVSNIETYAMTGADAQTLTLAANISATTINLIDASNQVVTLSAGYTNATTVVLGTTLAADTDNTDSVTWGGATNANVDVTVAAVVGDIVAGTTLTAGTGTDAIILAQANDTTVIDGDVTGFESVTITDTVGDNTSDVVITMQSYATAATIDASALDAGETDELDLASSTASMVIKGGDGVSTITGGAVADTIEGNGGADIINGGAGLDNISGGDGNDAITATSEAQFLTTLGTDTVDGGAGTDTLTFSAAATLTTAEVANISNVEVLALSTGSTLTVNDAFLTANPGISIQPGATSTIKASTATGDALSSSLNVAASAAGNLSLLGGTGDDTFTFYATETLTVLDTINGGTGDDQIILNIDDDLDAAGDNTTGVLDVNVTNVEKVTILDGATDDGGGGNTVITATVTINSGFKGTSLTVDGSSLDMHPTDLTSGERLTVDGSNNAATEALTLIGGGFGDSLVGGLAVDNLTGNAGGDTLKGGGGNDIISGGAGVDSLYGGAGIDHISGGAGNDKIVVDTFTDFKTSGGSETVDGGTGTDTLFFNQATALTLSAPELESIVGIEIIDADDAIGANATSITFGNGFFTSNGSDTISVIGNQTSGEANADNYVDLSSVSNGSVTFTPNQAGTDVNDTLIGGSGNDTWVVATTAAASLEATDKFDGNGGTDTISINNATATTSVLDFSLVTDVEQAVVKGNYATATSLDLGDIASTDAEPATFLVDGSAVTSAAGTLAFNASEDASLDLYLTTNFTIKGGFGGDTLYGAAGSDTIDGGYGTNTMGGNKGNDHITGGALADIIAGDAGADTIMAGGGIDVITGGTGNDSISAGDGADLVTGGAGKDTMTGGAGKDTFIYTAITESAGANADQITDFVSASDNIRITHTLPSTITTFILRDRGDTASDGTLPGILGDVAGDAAFITEGTAMGIDFTGDGQINANDFKINLDGATGMTVNDVDLYITAGAAMTGTLKTAGGNDSITGVTANVDGGIYYSMDGNDTIKGVGDGDETFWSGNGNDYIDVLTGTDTVYLNAGTGKVEIDNFTVATDILFLNMDQTTATTATGINAVIATMTADAAGDGTAYDFTDGMANTNSVDVVELDAGGSKQPNVANASLIADYTNDNAVELFKSLAVSGAGNNISGITVDNAGDKFYILAHDTDVNAGTHLYFANSAAVVSDTTITVNEVTYVAFFDGAIADAFASGATLKMLDFTTIDSTY